MSRVFCNPECTYCGTVRKPEESEYCPQCNLTVEEAESKAEEDMDLERKFWELKKLKRKILGWDISL